MYDFKDKVVLITGGTGGIGKAAAEIFLANDAIVYLSGRNVEKLQQNKDELSEGSKRVYIIRADVSSVGDCKSMVEEVVSKEGKLDILINSAGIYEEMPIGEVSEEIWERSFNTNVKGAYFLSKYALPHLEETKGCIVNVSSTAGVVGFDENSLYCATKGAINMFTKAFATECAPKGVRVNAVCPDMVKTEMLDVGFKRSAIEDRQEYNRFCLSRYPQGADNIDFITADEVAQCVVFLSASNIINPVTGVTMLVDYGITCGC